MGPDDVALRSQQFTEQVANRRDRYSAQRIDAYRSMPDVVNQYQQAQKHQVDMMQAGSQLAFDELRRKQAMEELAWSKELHSADMLALQKRGLEAQIDLQVAQANKAKKDLEGGLESRDYLRQTPEQMAYQTGYNGIVWDVTNGKVSIRKATPDEQASGKKFLEDRVRKSGYVTTAQLQRDWMNLAQKIASGSLEDVDIEAAKKILSDIEDELRTRGADPRAPIVQDATSQNGEPATEEDNPVTMDEIRSFALEMARTLRDQ